MEICGQEIEEIFFDKAGDEMIDLVGAGFRFCLTGCGISFPAGRGRCCARGEPQSYRGFLAWSTSFGPGSLPDQSDIKSG